MSGEGINNKHPVLSVRDLTVSFRMDELEMLAVDAFSFDVYPDETLAIVGESGCGKSVTSMSILRLVPEPGAVRGSIIFAGAELMSLSEPEMRRIRGSSIGMIFQEPMTSLNPVLTVGYQISEVLRLHKSLSSRQAWQRSAELLAMVGIPSPERRLAEYPHEFSGGMRQRAMIAMALACEPRLLIADEPTTALDVTIQAQILDLISDMKERVGASVLLITHDLGVVAEVANRAIVMYAGRKVEEGSVEALFREPLHPYTRGLLGAVPVLGSSADGGAERLSEIPGLVPRIMQSSPGCTFAPRCPRATELCRAVTPAFRSFGAEHQVACHHAFGEGAAL